MASPNFSSVQFSFTTGVSCVEILSSACRNFYLYNRNCLPAFHLAQGDAIDLANLHYRNAHCDWADDGLISFFSDHDHFEPRGIWIGYYPDTAANVSTRGCRQEAHELAGTEHFMSVRLLVLANAPLLSTTATLA